MGTPRRQPWLGWNLRIEWLRVVVTAIGPAQSDRAPLSVAKPRGCTGLLVRPSYVITNELQGRKQDALLFGLTMRASRRTRPLWLQPLAVSNQKIPEGR